MSDPVEREKALKLCSCGRSYTLESMPDYCPCGVGIFGSWARANAKIKDAPVRPSQPEGTSP